MTYKVEKLLEGFTSILVMGLGVLIGYLSKDFIMIGLFGATFALGVFRGYLIWRDPH